MSDISNATRGRKLPNPVRGEFSVELRHRCRHCRSKLPVPVENPHRAFCARGCYSSFYLKRCLVCEGAKPPGRSNRKFCRRLQCRTEYRGNKDRFEPIRPKPAPTPSLCTVSSKSAQSTGIKSAHNDDRSWRQIAGPELGADSFRYAAVGADVEPARRNARHWREAGAGVLIGRTDPPINLLGGYKFPNAPVVELTAPPAAARAAVPDSSHTIPDDLSIPNFLKVKR